MQVLKQRILILWSKKVSFERYVERIGDRYKSQWDWDNNNFV